MLYPLGRGGMGAVWVGEHIELRSSVAVKFIDPFLAKDESARKRFRIEAQAAAALRSPHVVQVFDYGVDSGEPYLVMELLEGETLASKLRREGQLTIEHARLVCTQMAKALSLAHSTGIVHRDLKPENVFLVGEGDGFYVKLLDFGVAKVIREDPGWTELVTQPGNRLGTLFYMSPEQVQGENIDARADIWSLAVMMFECLTGRLPFDGQRGPALISTICRAQFATPSAVADVPNGFDELFFSAIDRNLDHRLRSAQAFADSFEEMSVGLTGTCVAYVDQEDTVKRVLAYSSTSQVTLRETLETDFPPGGGESDPAPREELRVTTSIPAAINGRRDIDHIAIVARLSRKSGILWTAHRVNPGETIHLTLLFGKEEVGHLTHAVVERFSEERREQRPDLWPFELTVRFESPLPDTDDWKH